MNIKKKITAAFIFVSLCIMTLGAVSVSAEITETPASSFSYSVNSGEISIISYNGTDTTVIIPSTIDGKPVTTIGSSAFYGCSALESVTMGNGVKTIKSNVFMNCTSLKSVTFGDSVETIGGRVVYGCSSLESIIIPNSVTSLGYSAFNGCTDLADVVLSDKLEIIDKSTFYNCSSLKNIVIPESVKTIDDSAFYNCSALESVIIPNKTECLEYGAFNGCTGLKKVILGSGLKTIEKHAFNECKSLENVIMYNSVESIGDGAFRKCEKLKIYFTGTEDEFENITKGSDNGVAFKNDNMNYNYSGALTETLSADSTESSITTTSQAFLINSPEEVKAFGTIFIPLSLYNAGSTDTAIVSYDNSNYNIKDRQKYEATLTDIPEECKDWGIVAISFIRSGNDVSYSTAKYMSVNNTTLESATTATE